MHLHTLKFRPVFCHVCGTKTVQPDEPEQKNVSTAPTPSSPPAETVVTNQTVITSDENKNDSVPNQSEALTYAQGGKATIEINNEPAPPAVPPVTQYSQPVLSGSLPAQTVNTVQRKKTKLPWIIAGAAALVAIIIFVVLNWSYTDYIGTVKQHMPFSSYKGLEYTAGEVLEKYLDSPKWESYESNGVMYVKVTGGLEDFNGDFSAIFSVEPQGDYANIKLKSISIGNETAPSHDNAVEALHEMFYAYSQNFSSFSDYMEAKHSQGSSTGTSISTNSSTSEFKYKVSSEGVTITGYNGKSKDIEIPETLDGEPVVCIGNSAFENNWTLHSVTIPGSVKKIGKSAFNNCRSLTSINIPDSVTEIGESAFYYCINLTSAVRLNFKPCK